MKSCSPMDFLSCPLNARAGLLTGKRVVVSLAVLCCLLYVMIVRGGVVQQQQQGHALLQEDVRIEDILRPRRPQQKLATDLADDYVFEANPSNLSSRYPSSFHHLSSQPSYSLSSNLSCFNKDLKPKTEMRGRFWVFYNHIEARKKFDCNETITYTTHGESSYLDNLGPLLKRWQGPISFGLYSPGSDYFIGLQTIFYYRQCSEFSDLITDFVTFHLFFEPDHMPTKNVMTQEALKNFSLDCQKFNLKDLFRKPSYKQNNGLDYPINVARNIARETANSHYIFPSDSELYPNPGLIKDFLAMINRNDKILRSSRRKVFVNAIFEIEAGLELPNNKVELVKMLANKTVIPFHQKICSMCHHIPSSDEWKKDLTSDKLQTFRVAKRHRPFQHWEPIYICDHTVPLYDERLTWDGRADKMTQGFQMCVMDFDFHILNNAFLIHRPGIKEPHTNRQTKDSRKVAAQNRLISRRIIPQIKRLFGSKNECA